MASESMQNDDISQEQSQNVVFTQEENHTQSEQMTQTEFMTQNELTQLGDYDEDGAGVSSSSLTPQTPVNPRSIPWGRLIPNNHSTNSSETGRIDLYPRDPISTCADDSADLPQAGFNFMGLMGLKASDTFNEYELGRSTKCDIVVHKPKLDDDASKTKRAIHDWAHGIISNRHCKIFCMLKTPITGQLEMEVYVEDTSGNGTLINGTTLLRRGERRLLHTGDEISVVNPAILRKKMKSNESRADLCRHHSFLFVNVHQQQGAAVASVQPRLMPSIPPPPSSQRKGLVNVRATHHHSTELQASSTKPLVPFASNSNSSRRISPRRQPPRRIEEHYDIRDLLGSGTCGEVRRAIHRRTGQEFAVKVIPTKQSLLAEDSSALQAEAAMLQELNHPYIVKLHDVFCGNAGVVYLVMEILHGGDLFDRIVSKGKYCEVESRRVMRRLLSAVYYLHEDRQVVHRDLKPENILMIDRNSDIGIKLTDFGLAKKDEGLLKTFCGTPLYFAPEVLRRRHTVAGRGRYGKKADMFSLGVILYILLSGIPPFDGDAAGAAEGQVTFPPDAFANVSEAAKDLVIELLRADPKDRLSVQEACQHEWMLIDDGDTHIHPLDDPVLVNSRDNTIATKGSENNETTSVGLQTEEEPENVDIDEALEEDSTVTKDTNVRAEEKTSERDLVREDETDDEKENIVAPNLPVMQKKEVASASIQRNDSDISSHDTDVASMAECDDNKENQASSTKTPGVNRSDPPGEARSPLKSTVSPRDLNQQLQNFRDVLAKCGAKENRSSPPSHLPVPSTTKSSVLQATTLEKVRGGDGDTGKAMELTEDEICSQFSDDDSVSSFSASSADKNHCLERISSSSDSSVTASKPAKLLALPLKRQGKKPSATPKKKRRKKSTGTSSFSPSAAADEQCIWKHVSGDEQPHQQRRLQLSSGGAKKGAKGRAAGKKKSAKTKSKASKSGHVKQSTQTTLATFFRTKRAS